jgi:hypothetical protein
MAIAVTKPPHADRADDTRALKRRLRRLTFSGSYQDDQSTSTLTPAEVGLKKIIAVEPASGLLPASAFTTANEFTTQINATGTSVKFWLYENAAAASPSAQKTDNEAFITGQFGDFTFVGY